MTRADAPKRSRRAPARLDTGGDTTGLALAIRKSLAEQRRTDVHMPEAPVFRPTAAQFRDPLAFIASVREAGERSGLVRIIPPAGWTHEFVNPLAESHLTFETKRQHIHRLQEGLPFDEGLHYTYQEYRQQADAFQAQWAAKHPVPAAKSNERHVEQEYWRLVECCEEEVVIDYASDLNTSAYGSGFTPRPDGTRCSWDLTRLIENPGNVLRAVNSCLPGVTQPWLYYGMLFASFCWHKEDHNLYSINYLHHGASKTWHAVPGSAEKALQRALKQSVPRRFEEDPDLLHSLTTLLPPSACAANGVELFHTVQHAGEFIVTFPAAFHSGFSHGFNCAEAVNIGDAEWLAYGRSAVDSYRIGPGRRPATFSHEKLLWSLVQCCRGIAGTVFVPPHAHRRILQEAGVMAKEHLHLRAWLHRNGCRLTLPLQSFASSALPQDEECDVCGTLPFLAAVRCECSPGTVSCLHHGFTSCDCKGQSKRLEIRVAEADLLRLVDDPHDAVHLLPPGFVVDQKAPAAAPVLPAKRPPPVAAPQFRPNPRFQATNPDLCSECGGRGGLRASLLRCVACDAAFHGKCGDVRSRSRGSELVLCPSCYHAQF